MRGLQPKHAAILFSQLRDYIVNTIPVPLESVASRYPCSKERERSHHSAPPSLRSGLPAAAPPWTGPALAAGFVRALRPSWTNHRANRILRSDRSNLLVRTAFQFPQTSHFPRTGGKLSSARIKCLALLPPPRASGELPLCVGECSHQIPSQVHGRFFSSHV